MNVIFEGFLSSLMVRFFCAVQFMIRSIFQSCKNHVIFTGYPTNTTILVAIPNPTVKCLWTLLRFTNRAIDLPIVQLQVKQIIEKKTRNIYDNIYEYMIKCSIS